MEINKVVNLIENFAPLETQEEWDGSGWQIDFGSRDINKILLCLSLTDGIIKQAIEKKCDMIISHHPFIFPHAVPISFNKNIPIYSAHTNLDKAHGGTTDTLIELLGLNLVNVQKLGDFLRLIELEKEQSLDDFVRLLKNKLKLNNVRVVNNFNRQKVSKVAFCAGSGVEFSEDVSKNGADLFVTGDVKYHSALDSNVIIIDLGHFESEIPVLGKMKKILESLNIEVIIADEKVLLLIISLFLVQAVQAYQTVLVDFPENQEWHASYYQMQGSEAILQYVPDGQTAQNWTKTLIFHSYKNPDLSATGFMDRTTSQMESVNSSQAYSYKKYTPVDSIATRCVTKNLRMPTQCEIYRVSKSYEGLISMQYINKNVQNYKSTYDLWYEIVKNITIYQSYYRDDRIMNKSTSFEL